MKIQSDSRAKKQQCYNNIPPILGRIFDMGDGKYDNKSVGNRTDPLPPLLIPDPPPPPTDIVIYDPN